MFEMSAEEKENISKAASAIKGLAGIRVELVGAWLWVSGDTKPHKETLKASGFKWAHKKQMWYFAGVPSHHSRADMWYLKSKYGSLVVQESDNV